MNYKKAYFILLVSNLVFLFSVIWTLTHNRLYEKLWRRFTQDPYSPTWSNEVEKHNKLYTKPMSIVMLGNSITYEANWNELLGRNDIANRGIPGDVTLGMLARLESVFQLKPNVVFLEAGINDILSEYPIEDIKKNYKKLIDDILSKDVKLVVTLTFYTRYELDKNELVEELNRYLIEYCKNKQVSVIDLSKEFNFEQRLRKEVTHDGIHLNPMGYQIWANRVELLLKEIEKING